MTRTVVCFAAGETEWVPEPDLKDDTYWSGSAPLCVGGCRARHQELRRDPCGDSGCCWLGYKSLCRGKTTTIVTLAKTTSIQLNKSPFPFELPFASSSLAW